MNSSTPNAPPINLNQYPLDGQEQTKLQDLLSSCQASLKVRQYCSLPNFVPPAAVAIMANEAETLLHQANHARSRRNCYLSTEPDASYASDHPRNIFHIASYKMIAADIFPADSLLKQLYYWVPFQQFIAAVVGQPSLHPSADTLQPVNAICYDNGDQSAWHYDSNNAFTITLMLQAPASGGQFELAPNTRNGEAMEDIDYVREVLNGQSDRVCTVSRQAGELTIFRGCNSLHRVSPVRGNQRRIMAVLVYETQPNVVGDPQVNMTVYGRTS